MTNRENITTLPEEEHLYNTPSSWVWTRLGSVIQITGGSQPPKKVFINEPRENYTRLVQIRDFKSDNFLTYIPNEYANRPFKEDDIMIGRYGPPVFQILRGLSGSYNVALMKAEPIGGVLTKDFLFHLLQASFIQNPVIKDSQRSAGQSGVRRDLLESLPIPIPPRAEQKRIIKQLEYSYEMIAEVKQKLSKAKELIRLKHESLLRKALRGKLVSQIESDGIVAEFLMEIEKEFNKGKKKKVKISTIEEKPYQLPKNWEWVSLGDITNFINGDRGKNYPSKSDLVIEGIPFINAGHLVDGKVDVSNLNYVTEEKYSMLRSGKIEENDVLYCIRGTLGKTAIVDNVDKGAIASSLVIIRPSKFLLSKFLYFYLISDIGKKMIKIHDNGSAQPNLSVNNLTKYAFPLPPINEQKRIVEQLEKEFEIEVETLKHIEKAEIYLEKLRNSLSLKAFRGELVEQIPEEGTGLDLIKGIIE
ncbi:restriction endonuclease subunit S [Bacillus timonensis]|uniref:restriction endonuclease subunit S n=1 Tax=Bacillus timonensis TaxID=1033734 RepID=UPI000693BD2E|nr:restriction endonuclease subunit S [Bacillus timonensis]